MKPTAQGADFLFADDLTEADVKKYVDNVTQCMNFLCARNGVQLEQTAEVLLVTPRH